MKLNYLYFTFFLSSCLACLFLYFDLIFLVISFRWLGLLIIGTVYYKKATLKSVLFYLSLVFSGIGEAFVVLDFLTFFKEINVTLIIYWWLLIFLLKKSVNDVEYKIQKELILPLAVSLMLIVYFIYAILELVTPKIQDDIMYGYLYITSLLILLFYMGMLYSSKDNKRYSWLLFLLIAFVTTNILSPLEGLYYHHYLFEQLGCIIQIGSHFLLLKFLITPDEKISYLD